MSDEPTEGVLGSLPRTRPHRRSAKRGPAAEPAATQATPVATATGKADGTRATKGKTKATPSATQAKPKATARAKTTPAAEATPAAKAKPKSSSRRPPAGVSDAPVRSLQSATTPRAAGDRSRKPGVTSQAHHQGTPRTSQPAVPRRSAPPAAEPAGAVGTAVQAAAELTEIGLKASARALRGALSRLPRP